MTDRGDEPQVHSLWANLPPVEQAREWEAFRPGTFEQVLAFVLREAGYREEEAKHERRLDYIAVAIEVMTLVFALGAVLTFVWLAKYYVDHHAASQGVKIFGFGTASIVAAFLGVNATPIIRRLRPSARRNRSN